MPGTAATFYLLSAPEQCGVAYDKKSWLKTKVSFLSMLFFDTKSIPLVPQLLPAL